MKDNNRPLMVSIRCITYNHEPYIRQCLEGFVMQQTNFRFEAIVHDDASTDGTAAIVKEYAEKYPDIIKPIFETENQYSKHDGSLSRIMDEACRGKYIAMCEGDDYWIDPCKLQKQVDFLEAHPDCILTCSRSLFFSERKGTISGEYSCGNSNKYLVTSDVILYGGGFFSTCSIVMRNVLKDVEKPDYWTDCVIGDYPLQLYSSFHGKIYYFCDAMSVYRCDNPASWTGLMISENKMNERKVLNIFSEIKMLIGFSKDYPSYTSLINFRILLFILEKIPNKHKDPKGNQLFVEKLTDEKLLLPILYKVLLRIKARFFDNIFDVFKVRFAIVKIVTFFSKLYFLSKPLK